MIPTQETDLNHLERWLGKDNVAQLQRSMIDWPRRAPPIAVAGVPGDVFVHGGGHFTGKCKAGSEVGAYEKLEDMLRRRQKQKMARLARAVKQLGGFASLSQLISALSNGQRFDWNFQKVGTTGVVNSTNTLWYVGNLPSAGANGGAAPGGTAMTDATTGAFPFTNPSSGKTTHFVSANPVASVAGNQLLMYDRLFSVTKTMNSTATEAVTGVPTRYQSTTATDPDFIGGNFLMIECRTALPATAHNWTVCTYTDQANAASTLPSVTGNSSNIVNRLDQPAGQWFAPYEAGDYGIKALTQMQCSAAVASGAIDFTIGHPIAWMPCPVANILVPVDGVNSAVSLTRIFDDACLAFLEVLKSATGATTYAGNMTAAWN